MVRLFLLLATLSLTGCLFDDCSFDTEEVSGSPFIGADASAVGDTLTVAFVSTGEPFLSAFAPVGFGENRQPTDNGRVQLSLDAESVGYTGELPYRLEASTVGDTVYVYVSGRFDPSLVRQACSPPTTSIRIDISSISAPPNVRLIRTTSVDARDIRYSAARALRQRDAHRPISV